MLVDKLTAQGTTGLSITSESDIVACRKVIRDLTTQLGFGMTDVTRIVTSVSELARNVYVHAKVGEMRWNSMRSPGKIGIEIIFEDKGPGIADINQALEPGFSTAKSMGMGLPGVKKLMDELEIVSVDGKGTLVKVKKWAKVK
ncbi:MAG: anti-sigma regulatory factor [Methylobacter sp.]|nr:MAG: anti-sigma regulatory factor [Methylobacter sp.]